MDTPVAHDQPALTDADRAANAEQVYATIEMLWNDQVEMAAAMKERRKLYVTVIAATAAIGVFRIAWTHPKTDVSSFANVYAEYFARVLVVSGVVVVGWACVYLFREGDTAEKPPAKPAAPPMMIRGDWTVVVDRIEEPEPEIDLEDRSERAIAVIDLDDTEMAEMAETRTHLVWLSRAADLRAAYHRLVMDNNRVKRRLKSGLWLLGAGFGLLAAAVVTYTLAANRGVL